MKKSGFLLVIFLICLFISSCGKDTDITTTAEKCEHIVQIVPAIDATCSSTGLTEGKKCSLCKEILVEQETIPCTPHTEIILAAKNATCTEEGLTEGKKCSVCNEIIKKQEKIPFELHKEEIIKGKEPTCKNNGLTDGKKCSVCEKILVEQTVILASHKEEVIPGKDATCLITGLTEGKKCSVCKEVLVKQQIIPCVPHNESVLSAKEATCLEEGLTEGKYCVWCDKVTVSQKKTPKGPHKEEVTVREEATCSREGLTEGKKCSVCGEIMIGQLKIGKTTHNFGNNLQCIDCGFKKPIPDEIVKFTNQNSYDSWAKNLYDEENDRIITVYTSGTDHAYANKDIYVAEYKNGNVTYHLVKDGGAASIKAIGIIEHDGQYIVLSTWAENYVEDVTRLYRYTSTDLVNWTETDVTADFGFNKRATPPINIDNLHLIDGRLFTTLSYYNVDNNSWAVAFIKYSDDYGLTWHTTEPLNTINGVDVRPKTCPVEMVFHKIDDRIIMLARKGITNDRENAIPLLFGYSTDNGETWSDLVDTVGITDANNSNLSIAQYDENNVIVMFATRRRGTAGIYYSITPNDMAYRGEFNAPVKINEGAPISDYGYPYVFKTSDGWYYSFYSGTDSMNASVYMYKLPNDIR